jgi:hypothetical protein
MVVTHGPTAYDRDNVRYEDFGTTMTRLTVITGDNTGTLSGFKTITGPGTGDISGFDNLTVTGRVTTATLTTATLTVSGTPTFTDNTINGADLIDNTVTISKLVNGTAVKGALAYRSSNRTADNAVAWIIEWQAEDYDDSGIFTAATDNTKLVVPTGTIRAKIACNIQWDTGASCVDNAYYNVSLYKNGSPSGYVGWVQDYRNKTVSASGTLPYMQKVSTPIVRVSAGDYFQCRVLHTCGSAQEVVGTSNGSWFAMELY